MSKPHLCVYLLLVICSFKKLGFTPVWAQSPYSCPLPLVQQGRRVTVQGAGTLTTGSTARLGKDGQRGAVGMETWCRMFRELGVKGQ